MQTLTISRIGGRSNYTLSPTRNTGELQDKFAKCTGKSRKSAIRDLRTKGSFPKFKAGMSTADYVKMFEAWGTPCKPVEWEQLNEEPCTLYSGADTCETLPEGFANWEDFDAAQSADAAPESTLAAANDDAVPTVPDPDPAAPGAIVAADSGMLSDRERAEFDRVAAESMAPAWSADVNGAVRRGLDRTPIQHLPNYARMAIERADADSGLRSTAKVSELVRAYAATYGAIAEEWEIASALYICGRRFWDFDAAPDGAPVAAPIETAPAEVAPPHYAIGHPLTTQSDARAPVDGERFRILERSRATYDNLWTCAEVSTARRAADVAQSIIAGWTGGERWAVCADSGAFLYGIGADGKPMSAAPVCAPADDEPVETGAAWFERIIAENKAKRDDCEARAQKVAPLDSVPFKHSDGERFGIAGPCMSEPGRFRFSYFDSRGAIGHCTRDTLALAMWEALDLGYLYATEDTAPVDPLPTQSDCVPLPGELVTTFRALRVGVAFKFDSYGPVWVRARGGFRPGCGGRLHSCAPSVRVIRCSTQDARSEAEITAGARHTASLPSESDNAAPVAKPRVERERRADYLPDDDETIPAPLDGLDVAELDGLAEFERAGGEVKPTAPAYRDDAPRATPTPSLRIPAGDPRARIPARFARVYLLQA